MCIVLLFSFPSFGVVWMLENWEGFEVSALVVLCVVPCLWLILEFLLFTGCFLGSIHLGPWWSDFVKSGLRHSYERGAAEVEVEKTMEKIATWWGCWLKVESFWSGNLTGANDSDQQGYVTDLAFDFLDWPDRSKRFMILVNGPQIKKFGSKQGKKGQDGCKMDSRLMDQLIPSIHHNMT